MNIVDNKQRQTMSSNELLEDRIDDDDDLALRAHKDSEDEVKSEQRIKAANIWASR